MIEDTELLHRFATQNSEVAFAEIVRRHVDLVYSVALRIVGGDAHLAQDVSQAVFIALSRQAKALAGHRGLTGWLYLTTHHLAAQSVRSARRRQNREQQAHAMNEIMNTPDVDWHRVRPVLDEAMGELSEQDREAVLLRFFEQRPFAEIGGALRVSEDAARMRVDRAIERLRALLARRGVGSTAAALAGVLGTQVAAAPASLAGKINSAVGVNAMAGAGPLTTVASFLSPATMITGAVVIVAAGAVWFQTSAVSRRASEMALLREERGALRAEVDILKNQLRESGERVALPHSNAVSAAKQPAGVPVESQRTETTEVVANSGSADREAWVNRMTDSYDVLAKKLSLSAEQTMALKSLLRENFRRHGDLGAVASIQRLASGDPDVEAIELQADAELARLVRELLGESSYRAFQHFNEVGPMREFTAHVSRELADTSTPLTAEQAEQLIEILHRNRTRTPDGGLSGNPRALDIDVVIVQAREVLSEAQLAAVSRVHAERR